MQDDIASARKHERRIVGREIAGSRDDADVGESELVAVLYGVFFGDYKTYLTTSIHSCTIFS